mmetsp:Transcript_37722/g.82198  ORF Transcript_37722/g.82198 Transcript_37722/m.82198 type:complete len:333 (+) Transcript_37722:126-1124(+)
MAGFDSRRLFMVFYAGLLALLVLFKSNQPTTCHGTSTSRPLPPVWEEDVATVAQTNVTYRVPARTLAAFEEQPDEQILVGVLSAPNNDERRSIIRKMWAHRHSNVFFIVAGNWTEIQEEFEAFGDLIWLDRKESYRGLVWKTATMIVAFQKQFQNYRHILKTDDDTYILIGQIEVLSAGKHNQTDYWGIECNARTKVPREKGHRWEVSREDFEPNVFPPYSRGDGYLLSRRASLCFSMEVAHRSLFAIEDAFTGTVMAACGVQCVPEEAMSRGMAKRNLEKFGYATVYSPLTPQRIARIHNFTCSSEARLQEKSCLDAGEINATVALQFYSS